MGTIELILGPMFSGKSTELLRRLQRQEIARRRCILFKYSHDQRYDAIDRVSTHDLRWRTAVPCVTLQEHLQEALEYNVIGIDEGQFFADLVEVCEQLANAGKNVIVAALDGDFRRKPFGRTLELVPLAEDVVKLKAVCTDCLATAAFSKRLVAQTQQELIGGVGSYSAACRRCHAHQ